MPEFRGARGSNTGDDFHELWATRQAIRLLSSEDGLEAIAVEGVSARDEAGAARDTWDGVDCTLYFGGRNATEANHVHIEQLKYSAASPRRPWTIARLVDGGRRRSVIAGLAKAWKGLVTSGSAPTSTHAALISNQPVGPAVLSAVQRAAASSLTIPKREPRATEAPEARLAYASGLDAGEFRAFTSALRFDAGAGSRFALEEKVLRAIADWIDLDVQQVVTGLKQFIRQRMMPESAGETISRESVLLHVGASEEIALFPCPSKISTTEAPVSRAPVGEAIGMLQSGVRHLCLHGGAGVGKTTALQEIEAALPAGSIMVKYDCYGGGRYLDSDALRHRSRDAFIQLTNELAARLRLPLLLSRHDGSEYPRLFANRLQHSARALASQLPDALIVVAIDAADNAVRAAQDRTPPESSFVHDFVRLTKPPDNVRFVVTARTGRLEELQLPRSYCTREIQPFSPDETNENVARVWAAPSDWIDDFHHLSGGIPRVQDYAFQVDGACPSTALDRLRPSGKSLGDIFQQQFDRALRKSGTPAELARLCAALTALPRPVPLSDLAAILESTEPQLADICADLAPGIRLQDDAVGFADEDFEDFVRTEGEGVLASVRDRAAMRLLSRAHDDHYAALHVATALVAADRGEDLLDLVENESAPVTEIDPVLRREAELQRLRLAIKVCREAGDVARALRFVLMGAEGIKTETAMHRLLVNNPDLAARFAPETARRLILSDTENVESHGPLLFHKLSVDADQGDAISYREGLRFLEAWLQARKHHYWSEDRPHHRAWKISLSEISSTVEAALELDGPVAALRALQAWTPKRIALEVALTLPYRLIAEGRGDDVEALVTGDHLTPLQSFFLLVPLALSGREFDVERLTCGLNQISRRKLRVRRFFRAYHDYHKSASTHAQVIDAVLTACEILTIKRAAPELVDGLLATFLDPELRRIESHHAHQPLKLYFLFRAYTLRETRSGRIPDVKAVFEPRSAHEDEDDRRHGHETMERHDRPLMELAGAVFDIFAAVANALVNGRNDAELENDLRQAVGTLHRENWRISREHRGSALRHYAATYLLVLLAAGHAPQMVKSLATNVHGRWRSGSAVPDGQFVARLSLWPSLHESLFEDLAFAAERTRTMRIGANERSDALVTYSRLIKPLNKTDAKAIFDTAVDVASELDDEVMAQIRLLDKLVSRGGARFVNARSTARKLSNIIADAAVRLEGYEHFPWEQAMAALARMDAPLALANAARWDDESVAPLHETMAPVLKSALGERTITPDQASALIILSDDGGGVIAEILKQPRHEEHPSFPALVEEAAYDVLIRDAHRRRRDIVQCIEQHELTGLWSNALLRQDRFADTLAHESAADEERTLESDTQVDDPLIAHVWSREILLDSALLQEAVQDVWDRMRADGRFLGRRAILESVRRAVSPADRTAHLTALAELNGPAIAGVAVDAMLHAVDEWWGSPSVRAWCGTDLSDVIVTRFPEISRNLEFGHDNLTPALGRTGLSDAMVQELLLRGLERHVDGMGAELIFALAGTIGCKLPQSDAASLVDWYAERLEERVSTEYRDQTQPNSTLPQNADEAVARFLFAYMGDCDLRLRWRAAHAVRRLARTGDETTLTALVAEYDRRQEPVFRARNCEFYWLAARLWFVVVWDRLAGDQPKLAGRAGPKLLEIALDDSFPHLLVRSFARDACEKLVATGHLSLATDEISRLACVNESPLPRVPAVPSVRKTIGGVGHWDGFAYDHENRRFNFDTTDSLPYWYAPMLESFAAVNGERFLQEAERWILDVWGHRGELHKFNKEPRRFRFEHSNFALIDHGHGSRPTLERLHTHLEWHAMWCTAGELLKSEPLIPRDEYTWNELSERIDKEKLVEPPLWSADLRVPTPLVARNWQRDKRPLEVWAPGVRESDHRAEMFPSDSPSYVVVEGSSERRMRDRMEKTHVSSALVEPATGRSLVRALQTMGDSWDYRLPDEGDERAEIDEMPYRFLGWLRRAHRDDGIDEKDPIRGYALNISTRPGRRVSVACSLSRDVGGRPCWSNADADQPMFVYEVWGVPGRDEEQYRNDFGVAGQRLRAHKEQLLNFLRSQELDLIIEVEVTRRERGYRQFASAKKRETPEGRFARLYLLHGEGNLEIAEGCFGTWTGDSPTA